MNGFMVYKFSYLLGFGHFYEVTHCVNHTHNTGSILLDNGVVHFLEAKSIESTLLHCRAFDAALYLFNFDLCHFLTSLLRGLIIL